MSTDRRAGLHHRVNTDPLDLPRYRAVTAWIEWRHAVALVTRRDGHCPTGFHMRRTNEFECGQEVGRGLLRRAGTQAVFLEQFPKRAAFGSGQSRGMCDVAARLRHDRGEILTLAFGDGLGFCLA